MIIYWFVIVVFYFGGIFCLCFVFVDFLIISEFCKVCKEESLEFSKDVEMFYFFFYLEIGYNYWIGVSFMYVGVLIMLGEIVNVISEWKGVMFLEIVIKLYYGFNYNKCFFLVFIFMFEIVGCGVDFVKGFHWAFGFLVGLRDLCY